MTVETAQRLQQQYVPAFRPASKMIVDAITETLGLLDRMLELQTKHRETLDEHGFVYPEEWLQRWTQRDLRSRIAELEELDRDPKGWIEDRRKEECHCR